jgi:transcription antitermination factor NusA-like protein
MQKAIALLNALEDAIAGTSAGMHTELDAAFDALHANTDHVTVTVFGKTRVGKSTLIEGLIQGDGSSIGVGRQHTTREVSEHFWPPGSRALRLVDTPGVEGLRGAELAEKAQRFVDQSDHVLFLVTDDASTSGELEYFREIRTAGKSVTCLLNVKWRDKDLDLLLEHPELVFRSEEIAGHRRRILGYLSEQLGDDELAVLPIHARAGWLGRRHPDPVVGRALWDASRVGEIESRIVEFVRRDGIVARLSSPRQLLSGFVLEALDAVAEPRGRLSALQAELDEQSRATERTLRGLRRFAGQAREEALRGGDHIVASLPSAVDDLIAGRAGGGDLAARYASLYTASGLKTALDAYQRRVLDEFQRALQEQAQAAALDVEMGVSVGDLAGALDETRAFRSPSPWRRYGRTALRTGGGAVALGLWWAVANWWNPTGWLAGLAATLVVGAAGYASSETGRAVADRWRNADAANVGQRRDGIVDELTRRTRAETKRLERAMVAWEGRLFDAARGDLIGSLSVVRRCVDGLLAAVDEGQRRLEQLRVRVDLDLVQQAAALSSPEIRDGQVAVERVVRQPGVGAKIVVSARPGFGSPLGACLGRGGERARALRTALGGEPVAFVDAAAPLAEQVATALFPARVVPGDVTVPSSPRAPVRVSLPHREIARAVGPGGRNVDLVERAVGRAIRINARKT